MSSTVISPMQTPNPMKKKVLAALITVVVGHMGVLWAVNHMKAPELKPIEKEPLKVRFVKIQELPKPLPPKPKEELKKEPTKPKEVKIVEKPQPTPPKKVEKVQQVKKAEVVKPVVKPTETPVKPTVTTTITEKKVEKPVVQPEQAKPVTQAEPADTSPKSVSVGGSGVQWSRSPKPVYSNQDLQGENRRVVVLIEANEKGSIVNARITRSSGVPALDEKILRAVKGAKFKPYKENGVAYPIRAEQPFDLELNTKR
ncbi:energy transducer TonB [Acinetobacter johnsonii]|uniref:TonB family protein n=1 Tax=Acinetobacter johnsonii TaxID=40214 RepID=A0AA42M9A3_ACIJO|nr:TonB family protein [Acinetobacter johnsonii]MDH0825701.1 TonB family protein [Acinetobacter johnsonii]